MNTDHPDTRRTASEIHELNRKQAVVDELNAANRRITEIQHNMDKQSPRLPCGWIRVEATNNGWGVYIDNAGGPPQFVFNNVFDCARKIVNLLCPDKGEEELQAKQIRCLSERLLGSHGDNIRLESTIKDLQNSLDLMTAGREVDRAEHLEAIKTYQARIRELESEISGLGKILQGVPPIQCGRVMACVEGKLYTIDDLCKQHAELLADVANLRTENRQYSEVLKGEGAERARLIQEVGGLAQEINRLRERVATREETISRILRTCQNPS